MHGIISWGCHVMLCAWRGPSADYSKPET